MSRWVRSPKPPPRAAPSACRRSGSPPTSATASGGGAARPRPRAVREVDVVCNNARRDDARPAWCGRCTSSTGGGCSASTSGVSSTASASSSPGWSSVVVVTSSTPRRSWASAAGRCRGRTRRASTRLWRSPRPCGRSWHAARPGVGVTVLCPSFVPTRIGDAHATVPSRPHPAGRRTRRAAHRDWSAHEPVLPLTVGQMVVSAISSGRFYLTTHPGQGALVRRRMESILADVDG